MITQQQKEINILQIAISNIARDIISLQLKVRKLESYIPKKLGGGIEE